MIKSNRVPDYYDADGVLIPELPELGSQHFFRDCELLFTVDSGHVVLQEEDPKPKLEFYEIQTENTPIT